MVDRRGQHEYKQQPKPGPDTPVIAPQAQGVGGYKGRPYQKPMDQISGGMFDYARQGYKDTKLGYDPYLQSEGPQFETMNYDPYRQAGRNQADASAAQQYVAQQSQLSGTGGMTTADRIKAINDFNRNKILGRLGSDQKYDQAGSQNVFDVGKMNTTRGQQVGLANIEAQNMAARANAQSETNRVANLYGAALDERDLQRKLAASKLVGEGQMNMDQPWLFKAFSHWGDEWNKIF